MGFVFWIRWLRLLGVLGLLLAALAPAANAQPITDSWERLGALPPLIAGAASYTSLVFGPDGKPYVAYRDGAHGFKASVMRLNSGGTAWEEVGPAGFSAGVADYTSLAFGPDGRPYVAYLDQANGNKASVMRLNSAGTAWEVVGAAGFSAGAAYDTSLAFSPDGRPYVAYQDVASVNKASVMRLNSAGTAWERVGASPPLIVGAAAYTSLSFGPDGKPYVAYRDIANGNKASVIRLNSAGTAWDSVGAAGFSAGGVLYTSLSFGPDGKPYVAYLDQANGRKASVMRLNSAGTAWERVGAAGFSAGEVEFTSLAFGPDGKPYVAYQDVANGYKASVMRLNSAGTAWEVVGGAEGLSPDLALYTSLAFSPGPEGKPYVAYLDVNGGKASVMRLNSAGTAWQAVGAEGFSAGAVAYTSLSFGPDGKPYVAYLDVANGNKASVMRLNSAGTAWEAVGAAGFSAGGALYTSLSFGPDGKPYVAFQDQANDLKPSLMRWTGTITIATAQSISFPAQTVASRAFAVGSTFNIAPVAVASSGLPVSYQSSTPAVCTVSGTTVTMAHPGTCTVLARQAGNTAWQPATDASQSISISANTSWSGPMSGVTGDVQVAFTGASASCTIDPTQTGFGAATGQMHTGLQAQYPGATLPNSVFAFRASGCAGDTLTVIITYPEAVADQNLLLKWGPASSGQASSWFNPGVQVSGGRTVVSYTVTDDGAGDSETTQPGVIVDPFAIVQVAAIPPVLAQSISFPAQTVTSRPFAAGSTFEIAPLATATSGLPVSYESSTPTVCTVSGTTITMAGLGACTVLARQAGNTAWQPAPDASQSISFAANSVWSGPMTGMTGNVQVAFSGASASCSVVPAQTGFSEASEAMQTALQAQRPGATLPGGAFAFRAEGCAGDTLTVQLTFPEPVSAEAQFLKWGPSANGQPSSWFDPGVQVSGDRTVVSYTVTDDGAGDSETTQPGVIVDPFAIVLPAAIAPVLTPTPVPTLHQWMLMLMAAAAALMGGRALRRR